MREILQWRTYDGAIVKEQQAFAAHAWMNVRFANEANTKSATTLAFLDTGKSSSALSKRLIDELGLRHYESTDIATNTETIKVPLFRTVVSVPSAPNALINMDCIELMNPFTFTEAEAIIGMGLLQFGALVMQPIGMDSFFQMLTPGKPLIQI